MVHNPKMGKYWLMSHINHEPNSPAVAFAIKQRSQKTLIKSRSKNVVYSTISSAIQTVKKQISITLKNL